MRIKNKGRWVLLMGLLAAGLDAAAQTGTAAARSATAPGTQVQKQAQDTWTVNIRNADIQAFITQVAQMTGKNFIVDPRVRSRDVTVISSKPLTSKQVYELFLSVLQVHGYAAVETGDIIKIVNNTVAKQNSQQLSEGDDRPEADAFVTRVLPVENASANELVPVLRPLVPQYGHLAAVEGANVLIISDHAENIARIESIIAHLDGSRTEDVRILRLEHAWVGDVVEVLQAFVGTGQQPAKGRGAQAAGELTLIADKRTNRLIVKGDPAAIERVQALVTELDIPHEGEGTIQVIRLAHADAKSLAELLQNFVDGKRSTGSSGPANRQPQPPPAAPGNGEISIQADESMNALVIRAEPERMNELKSVIDQLDTRRAQILIEAAIVEVTGDQGRSLGFQYLAGDPDNVLGGVNFSDSGLSVNQILAAITTGNLTGGLGDGITVGGGEFDSNGDLRWGVILQALASTTNANLLSTPSILTLDNQEASIIVGENVPFVTGQSTNTGSGVANPFTTIQRQDVGLTLKVIPHVAGDRTIRLELEQETSSVKDTPPSTTGNQQPVDIVTTKRQIKTVVLADDGETIVLGGLIRDDVQNGVRKVPLLGDIPVLGTLFRSTRASRTKQNLMVFLRPTILADNQRLTGLTRERYLGITALQFEVNRKGELERVVKHPLPSDPSDLFRGRDPLPPRLLEYYESHLRLPAAGENTQPAAVQPPLEQPRAERLDPAGVQAPAGEGEQQG